MIGDKIHAKAEMLLKLIGNDTYGVNHNYIMGLATSLPNNATEEQINKLANEEKSRLHQLSNIADRQAGS